MGCKWCRVSGLTNPNGICRSCVGLVAHFDADQLGEALEVCEVTWMEEESSCRVGTLITRSKQHGFKESWPILFTWRDLQIGVVPDRVKR